MSTRALVPERPESNPPTQTIAPDQHPPAARSWLSPGLGREAAVVWVPLLAGLGPLRAWLQGERPGDVRLSALLALVVGSIGALPWLAAAPREELRGLARRYLHLAGGLLVAALAGLWLPLDGDGPGSLLLRLIMLLGVGLTFARTSGQWLLVTVSLATAPPAALARELVRVLILALVLVPILALGLAAAHLLLSAHPAAQDGWLFVPGPSSVASISLGAGLSAALTMRWNAPRAQRRPIGAAGPAP